MGCQPQPSASAHNPYLDLNYSGYHISLIQSEVVTGKSETEANTVDQV